MSRDALAPPTLLAACAAALMLAACSRPAAAPGAETPSPVAATSATAPIPSTAPPAVVTLKGLESGDRACYVVVVAAEGERSLEGDFELCPGGAHDASALIGRQVTYATRPEKVLAASCEGNADCGESDLVDLVVEISAAPP